MNFLRRSLPLGLFLVGTASLAAAGTHTYNFAMTGAQENPPVSPSGSGTCTVVLDDVTGVVTVSGTYTGMTSAVILAHIHGAAPVGMNAGILVTLTHTGGTSGTVSGSGTLSAAQVTNLLNGLHYVNIHSSMHTGGEIRGQIVCEPATAASVSFRNGTGVNLAGFAATTMPIIGANWMVTVDVVTPPGVLASIVAFGAGGPITAGTNFGELLCLPPYTLDVANGSHSIPLPDDCSLVGSVACFQGATFAPMDIRLQNALDGTFGTF